VFDGIVIGDMGIDGSAAAASKRAQQQLGGLRGIAQLIGGIRVLGMVIRGMAEHAYQIRGCNHALHHTQRYVQVG
jgi:hypothetical protein